MSTGVTRSQGGIKCFMMLRLFDLITGDPGLSSETTVVLLHSQMPSSEHKKAFQSPAKGCRKVVLATNVAETGITIQDIVYVIDSGKVEYSRVSCYPDNDDDDDDVR